MINLPEDLTFDEKVKMFNDITQQLYDWLGLNHPSLNVQLVKVEDVKGNDYNPNRVAPPEERLLELSIIRDGITMPVVVSAEKEGESWIVVDGFHRRERVARSKVINESTRGYLPVSKLHKSLQQRVTSTVRHNLARGTHQVELSSKLVLFLKKHNWTDQRIGKEIGMDADEVLRLKQITGLAEAFANKEFSKSWQVDKS